MKRSNRQRAASYTSEASKRGPIAKLQIPEKLQIQSSKHERHQQTWSLLCGGFLEPGTWDLEFHFLRSCIARITAPIITAISNSATTSSDRTYHVMSCSPICRIETSATGIGRTRAVLFRI